MRPVSTVKDAFLLSLLADVEREIKPIFGDKLEQLVLFGSYARGEQEEDSDIDIMILVDETEEKLKKYEPTVADIMGNLCLRHEKLISLIEIPLFRYKKYLDVLPFYQNVYNEGVEIYGRQTA